MEFELLKQKGTAEVHAHTSTHTHTRTYTPQTDTSLFQCLKQVQYQENLAIPQPSQNKAFFNTYSTSNINSTSLYLCGQNTGFCIHKKN